MKKLIALFGILLVSISCSNVLEQVAKKDTEQAVFFEAKMALNERNYDSAITLLQSLGPAFLAQRNVSLIYASAYSGRCGLEFVTLVESLTNMSTDNLFLFLQSAFPGGTDTRIADCLASEAILNGLGDYTQRLSDENILMGFSSLTKVGTILSRYSDLDSDGITDPAFDHCSLTDLPDSAVREVGTGVANAVLSISSVASDISSGTLDDITAYCALAPELNVFCTNTDPNAYSALELRVFRQLIGSTDLGVGACTNFTDLACVCP
ncbi:MAG: hypothetical protein IT287_01530 [Bdellovibrionaceae bacterium]|nr:hypothetical protein [Pseudobdellovibrionaceae bacterium]